jgi:hypothetical protein
MYFSVTLYRVSIKSFPDYKHLLQEIRKRLYSHPVISPRISRNTVGLLKGNTRKQKVFFMLSMVLKHEIHTVNVKISSGKEMSIFHVALRTI